MGPSKTLCWFVLVAMLPQLIGCRSFYPVEGHLPASPNDADPAKVYRVSSTDGSSVNLSFLWTDSAAVRGIIPNVQSGRELQTVEVPIEDVRVIEVERLSVPRTLGLAALCVAAGWGLYVLTVHAILDAAFDEMTFPTGG